MPVIPLKDIEAAADIVYRHMRPTPEISWPLLNARVGAEVIVKHENHTPIGAFKVRGGLNYMTRLKAADPDCPGVITATRGNHGQSVSRAATAVGLRSVIYVPHGNNPEKNAAMEAFGAELMEYGDDFQESREEAARIGEAEGLHMIPPFHPDLVAGVGTYALELMQAHPDLDTVYVPIGMGSGICGLISARDGLGLKTRIVGIVADRAPAYALSFDAGEPVNTNDADTFADGVACRSPDSQAVEIINAGADRIVRLTEDEFRAAMRAYFYDTHNIAEGAGAGPLAGLLQEKDKMAGKKVGVILSGGNADRAQFFEAMTGE
ncbi:MAG: threonine dehydratase [Rhodospirillales bacterium]|nr:threonine dehydratase [Rhodospirillales bacterium]MBO6787496.1 threonine dehydratase [Rhodospirillales bacterium]